MSSIADIAAALRRHTRPRIDAVPAILDGEILIVPELLSWLKAATRWEINRRAGSCQQLLSPRAAILDHGDVECSLIALAFLHATLRNLSAQPTSST